jgi:aspartate aminotransferase
MPVALNIQNALIGSSAIRKLFEEGAQLKKLHGESKVFDFSIGNPDVDPPPEFHETICRLLKEKRPLPHGYMPNAGFPDVRARLAQKVSREQGALLSAEHITMSVGAAGGLNAVLKAILNAADEVLVTKPYFMEYRAYVANHGGVLVPVDPAPDFNLDIDAIACALSAKTAAVIINSPHNPTGRVYPAKTLSGLAKILAAHGKKTGRFPVLVSDEPYREIVYDGIVPPPVLCAYPESVVVSSYSKNLSLPGERIGYIAISPDMADAAGMAAALSYTTRVLGFVNAPALAQRAVAELTQIAAPAQVYAKRRASFMEVLDKAGLEYVKPEGAFYLFVKVPNGNAVSGAARGGANDTAFSEHLKKYLILAVPGAAFEYPGWIRFAYCVDEKVIRAAQDPLMAALSSWAGG